MNATTTSRRRTRASTSGDVSLVERSVAARLARVHLRSGMLAMARSELEALVVDGALDTPALADLAEARWRSGDLSGAGAAAAAHLDEGGNEPIALVVAAESLAARGRTAEARANAKLLLDALANSPPVEALELLFAGQPRAAVWPGTAVETTSVTASDGEVAAARPVARDEIAVVEEAIAARGVRDVAVRLAILLRHEGALAPLVLSLAERALVVAATPPVEACLHIVCGDAFRTMGREIEASAAFERARQVLGEAAPSEPDR